MQYEFDSSRRSEQDDSQIQYLKNKLLEKHEQLMLQMKKTAKLEMQLKAYDKDQGQNQKNRLVQLALVQTSKKNDLLRQDLQSMREKLIQYTSVNKELEERVQHSQKTLQKLSQKHINTAKQLRRKQLQIQQCKQQLQNYKIKIQKQNNNYNKIESEFISNKTELTYLQRKIQQVESNHKHQRQRIQKLNNELLLSQKQIKEWRQRCDQYAQQITQLRQIPLQREQRDQRGLVEQLQKLTQDYNQLNTLYRSKQRELQQIKQMPKDNLKKKNDYEHTKEFVSKLDREESDRRYNSKGNKYVEQFKPQMKGRARINTLQSKSPLGNSRGKSPLANSRNKFNKNSKNERSDYLNIISQVSSMENEMYDCNLQRKRIMEQIDKIDATRVKTKDMFSKRKRFQAELISSEKKLERIRIQLKKLKVM